MQAESGQVAEEAASYRVRHRKDIHGVTSREHHARIPFRLRFGDELLGCENQASVGDKERAAVGVAAGRNETLARETETDTDVMWRGAGDEDIPRPPAINSMRAMLQSVQRKWKHFLHVRLFLNKRPSARRQEVTTR